MFTQVVEFAVFFITLLTVIWHSFNTYMQVFQMLTEVVEFATAFLAFINIIRSNAYMGLFQMLTKVVEFERKYCTQITKSLCMYNQQFNCFIFHHVILIHVSLVLKCF